MYQPAWCCKEGGNIQNIQTFFRLWSISAILGPAVADFRWKLIIWPLPVLRVSTSIKITFQKWSKFCLADNSTLLKVARKGSFIKSACFSRVALVVHLLGFLSHHRRVSFGFTCSHFPLQAHDADMFMGGLFHVVSSWIHYNRFGCIQLSLVSLFCLLAHFEKGFQEFLSLLFTPALPTQVFIVGSGRFIGDANLHRVSVGKVLLNSIWVC